MVELVVSRNMWRIGIIVLIWFVDKIYNFQTPLLLNPRAKHLIGIPRHIRVTMQQTSGSNDDGKRNNRSKGSRLMSTYSADTTTVNAYGIDLPVPLSSRASLQCEVDYLGMINFCLRKTDTALSGSSKSKLLNAITNEVFRAIMIAYPPYIDNLLGKFPYYMEELRNANCFLESNGMINLTPPPVGLGWSPGSVVARNVNNDDDNEFNGQTCATDSTASKRYLDALEGLLRNGMKRTQPTGDAIYDTGYARLLTLLREAVSVSFDRFNLSLHLVCFERITHVHVFLSMNVIRAANLKEMLWQGILLLIHLQTMLAPSL
jgi:hypothetical protein